MAISVELSTAPSNAPVIADFMSESSFPSKPETNITKPPTAATAPNVAPNFALNSLFGKTFSNFSFAFRANSLPLSVSKNFFTPKPNAFDAEKPIGFAINLKVSKPTL